MASILKMFKEQQEQDQRLREEIRNRYPNAYVFNNPYGFDSSNGYILRTSNGIVDKISANLIIDELQRKISRHEVPASIHIEYAERVKITQGDRVRQRQRLRCTTDQMVYIYTIVHHRWIY